ncbi:MAG: hypothetical protein KKC79_18225 [Gammaproteobacteria bacterium]|nr:hypothetical protein [Gammaproteobacteria bacterium]MBU1441993.1 hypothetical protein [Gammaproteobacteria bacterium]MBU2288466.1 hypothetical protein [Gammaproteobacteria bacterium]MBU2410573.1 hypothetical protein [Gammaproteobacteria bacterium]
MTDHPRNAPARRSRVGLGIALAATMLLLAGIFGLYQQPDFLIMMVNQVWSCF